MILNLFRHLLLQLYMLLSAKYNIYCITYCVSHQNTCNYSLSAIVVNNHIDSYDLEKTSTWFLKLPFFIAILVEIEKWNIKSNVNPCHSKKAVLIVMVSVQHMANAMPTYMVKPLYIQALSSLMKKQYNWSQLHIQ